MKKIITTFAILLATAYISFASANNGFYITGNIGTSIVENYDSKVINHNNGHTPDTYSFKNKTNGVFSSSVALGYNFNEQYQIPARIEIKTILRATSNGSKIELKDDNDVKINARNKIRMDNYMASGFYDFYNSSAFTPYITASIGITHLKNTMLIRSSHGQSHNDSVESNNFSWGLGTGIRYQATNNIIVDASYKYIDGGKIYRKEEHLYGDEKYKAKVVSHDVMLGATYQF